MFSSTLALITVLWFGSLLLPQCTATTTAAAGKAYEDTHNAYQPGQPLKIVLNTLDKVLAPVETPEDEPEVMHFLPVPAEIEEKVYETFLPTNSRWEIQFDPKALKLID